MGMLGAAASARVLSRLPLVVFPFSMPLLVLIVRTCRSFVSLVDLTPTIMELTESFIIQLASLISAKNSDAFKPLLAFRLYKILWRDSLLLFSFFLF